MEESTQIEAKDELVVAKEPTYFGAHMVFDEMPTLVDDNGNELIDDLLNVPKVESTQTIVQDEDQLTEELLVHVVLDQAEEPAQIEMKDEPVVVSPLPVFTVHQVFDQMPKSLISCEFKLWDELPTNTEMLGKEELDLGSLLVRSYEEQNDRKVSEVGKLNESGDLIMLLILLPLEVYIQKGYARTLCFDPGGGALLFVGGSLNLEVVTRGKSELQYGDEELPDMTNLFGACSSDVLLSKTCPLSTHVVDQQSHVNIFSQTSYLDSMAQELGVWDASKVVVAAYAKREATTWVVNPGGKRIIVVASDFFSAWWVIFWAGYTTQGFVERFCFDPGGEWLMLAGMVHNWKGSFATFPVSSWSSLSAQLVAGCACVESGVFDPRIMLEAKCESEMEITLILCVCNAYKVPPLYACVDELHKCFDMEKKPISGSLKDKALALEKYSSHFVTLSVTSWSLLSVLLTLVCVYVEIRIFYPRGNRIESNLVVAYGFAFIFDAEFYDHVRIYTEVYLESFWSKKKLRVELIVYAKQLNGQISSILTFGKVTSCRGSGCVTMANSGSCLEGSRFIADIYSEVNLYCYYGNVELHYTSWRRLLDYEVVIDDPWGQLTRIFSTREY